MIAILAFMNVPAALGTLRVSDSARVAVRSGGVENDELGFDNLLRLDASLAWPTTELFAGYAPRLGLADDLERTNDAWELTFLHDMEAGIRWTGPRHTLTLRQTFGIGTQSFGEVFAVPEGVAVAAPGEPPLPGTPPGMTPTRTDAPPGSGAPVPLDSNIPVWSTSTNASLDYAYTARWRSTFAASFGTSGGNGATAELTYPRLQIADADADVVHDITPRHQLGVQYHGERGWTRDSDYWYTTLAGAWSILFSPETDLSLSAGAGFRDTRDPGSETARSQAIVPVGSASLVHQVTMRGGRARYELAVGYQPSVDTLRARLQDRLSGSASASLATTSSSATLSLSGSQSFPTDAPDAARFVGLSLALAHRFNDRMGIELGGQIADQQIGPSDSSAGEPIAQVDDGTVWTVYLGLGAQLDPIRF